MTKHYDIVIVGAGIVGATLAALLLQKQSKGAASVEPSIAIVDAASALPDTERAFTPELKTFDPRVVALSEHSKTILEQAQVWPLIKTARVCPYYRMHVWDSEGTGQISFDTSSTASNELGHICENRIVVGALHEVLAENGNIDLIFGEKIRGLHSVSNKHELYLENDSIIHAKLIIGADGAESKIRDLVGLQTKEWDYQQSAIVTTVETEKPHDFCAWQRFSPRGPLAFLPLSRDGSDQLSSSIVWSIDSDYANELMALNDEQFCKALGGAIEFRLGNIRAVDRRYVIPLRQRFAKKYVRPGIALVGDAAHTIHPLAGQGVNLGLHDVKVLHDELLRAFERQIPLNEPATLRRYERKRQPHNLMTMASMEMFKRGFGSQNLGLQWLRNTGLNLVDRHPLIKRAFSRAAAGNRVDG